MSGGSSSSSSDSDREEVSRSGSEEREHIETVDKKGKGKGKEVQPPSDASQEPDSDSDSDGDSDSASSVGSNEIVDVDFEFFDPHAGDFHAIKRLLQNTFGDDSEDFDLSQLADLCLAQPHGTTVKMDDDPGSDPYAFMTLISLKDHRESSAVVGQITEYLERKAPQGGVAKAEFAQVLRGDAALVVSERIVNMPPQIVPPMLRLLVDELGDRRFDHYIVLAPMYREIEALDEDDDDNEDGSGRQRKRAKVELDAYVHAEDEFVEEFAKIKFDYRFSRMKRVAEARNSFGDMGIAPSRRCLVVERAKFPGLLARLNEVLAP